MSTLTFSAPRCPVADPACAAALDRVRFGDRRVKGTVF